MKTTLELPDELMRAVKIRAVQRDQKLKDFVTDALRASLSDDDSAPPDPVQVLRRKLVFHADGTVTNPHGINDPSFFETLETLREQSRHEPDRDPFGGDRP